jgi:hypothetical protein
LPIFNPMYECTCGRDPAVSLSSGKIAHLQRHPYMQQGAGGVSPPWSALGMRTRNAKMQRITLADAVCEPRRADARRSFWACVCASKNSFFAGRRSYTNTRAGGVSPPWNALRMWNRNAEVHRIAVADAVCEPRRADARRSWLSVRLPLNSAYLLPHSAGVGHHGGLTPAAPVCRFRCR